MLPRLCMSEPKPLAAPGGSVAVTGSPRRPLMLVVRMRFAPQRRGNDALSGSADRWVTVWVLSG
jgi:hypothetical protein